MPAFWGSRAMFTCTSTGITRPAATHRRSGRAQFSITLTGLSVRADALYNENGQMGVWVYDVPGGTFVPVEVLSTSGSISMIQPLVDGALSLGQQVLIK